MNIRWTRLFNWSSQSLRK